MKKNIKKAGVDEVGRGWLAGPVFSAAVILKKELLLFIIGGVFVIESLSVIIQVYYFRHTKNKYG